MNYNSGISGIYRAKLIIEDSDIRVYVPSLHSINPFDENGVLKSNYNKYMFPQALWCAYNLESIDPANQVGPAWVMFENGNIIRPVILSYTVIGGGNSSSTNGNNQEDYDAPIIDVELIVSDSELINKVVNWAVAIANDDSHGYSYGGKGPTNYDCSGFIWAAYNKNGLSTLSYASTGSMKGTYAKVGFVDVTSAINLSTGDGLMAGDILLNVSGGHVDMYIGNGQRVGAHSSKTGIYVDNYGWNQTGYNNKYDCILRYNKQ